MSVTPLPGADRKTLLETLRAIHADVGNLKGLTTSNSYQYLLAYLEWASNAMTKLVRLLRPSDIDRLVLTKHYEMLVGLSGMQPSNLRAQHLDKLIVFELEQRETAFDEVVQTLAGQLYRWSFSDYFIVADSSFYIHHPENLEASDLADLVGFHDGPIHLIFPMVVVDELDSLKQSKASHTRGRASYTLAVLDRLLQGNDTVYRLREADPETQRHSGVRCGEVNVDIFLDPPGHVRLPINDDEIVDRALAIKPLVGRQVTLLTYDTGQATRGRQAGLNVIKLVQPVEPPAEDVISAKAKK